mgnify:CR=1 FL=1
MRCTECDGAPILMACGGFGGSIGIRKPHLVAEYSMLTMDQPTLAMTLSDYEKAREKPREAATVNLINAQCWYYHHGPEGCTRPDCRFLHDEASGDVPFYDHKELSRKRLVLSARSIPIISAGPPCDAKVYLKNIPPSVDESMVRDISRKAGATDDNITKFVLTDTVLSNGHRAGIMIFKSKAQAKATIDAICKTIIDGVQLFAQLQSCSPVAERPALLRSGRLPRKPQPDDDGWMLQKGVSKSASDKTDAGTTAHSGQFDALLTVDEDNATNDTGLVVTTPKPSMPALLSVDEESPVSVMNKWASTSGSDAMRKSLAIKRQEEDEARTIQKVMIKSRLSEGMHKLRGTMTLPSMPNFTLDSENDEDDGESSYC